MSKILHRHGLHKPAAAHSRTKKGKPAPCLPQDCGHQWPGIPCNYRTFPRHRPKPAIKECYETCGCSKGNDFIRNITSPEGRDDGAPGGIAKNPGRQGGSNPLRGTRIFEILELPLRYIYFGLDFVESKP